MTIMRRMQVLEQRAGTILLGRGYTPFIVSHFIRSSRYVAFNLTARKILPDGAGETVLVKIKIALHPAGSSAEAAVFCRDEISTVMKFHERMPPDADRMHFEVWLALPRDGFQQFRITRSGTLESISTDAPAGPGECPHDYR